MRRIVVVFALVLAACSGGSRALPRVSPVTTPAAPPTTTGATLQPLRDALQAWATFPVDASPRPLILTSDPVSTPARGFATDDAKLAFGSGAFTAPAALPSAPRRAAGYPVTTAAEALAVMRAEGQSSGNTSPAPLVISRIRFGASSFQIDRGTRSLPAWLFSFRGVDDPAAVLAVAPSARFAAPSGSNFASIGARLGPDGRAVTITFGGAAAGRGPCTADYAVDQLASDTAVAVRVRETRNGGGTCAAVGYTRHEAIVLASPLGNRVLVDATSKAPVAIAP